MGWHLVVVWLIWRLYALGWDGVNGFDGAIGCGLGGGETASSTIFLWRKFTVSFAFRAGARRIGWYRV